MRALSSWVLVVAPLLLGAAPAATADPAQGADLPLSPDRVMASLKQTFAWYQEAKDVMRSVNQAAGAVFAQEDEQTVVRLLQRAFDTAQAQAALLTHENGDATNESPSAGRRGDQQARVQAAIQREEQEVSNIRTRLRTAPARARPALQRELVVATERLELDHVRLQFITKLHEFDTSLRDADADLPRQIQALQDAAPELRSPSTGPGLLAAPHASVTTGTWALLQRLVALQRSHESLRGLTVATNGLVQNIDNELHATQASVRPTAARLRALVNDPGPIGTPLNEREQQFRDLLDRGKLLGAVLLPLREESALAHRYASDLKGWERVVDRASGQAIQGLAIQLIGVAIALAVIFVGAILWRIAAVRYVSDAYRRRLLLMTRNVVAVAAIALVLIFHFTSELAALVTALGIAAAGIAFALQNVILAVAGYCSIVAPNGIRVGDRVSLQGPFGYVHGDVAEIGLVRIKLRELAGDPLQPTGRLVVFPNSVVFTGSFFKHLPREARA